MKKIKIIPILKDNALSFEKYISDINLLKIEDASYKIFGAISEYNGKQYAVGGAVLHFENNSIIIESLIADEADEDQYFILVKLLRHICSKARLMKKDSIYCSYYSPDEDLLESALFEMEFALPETTGILLSVSQQQIKELCINYNITAKNVSNDHIFDWAKIPDKIKNYIVEMHSMENGIQIDNSLSKVFLSDDGKEILSYIIFDNYSGNAECRDFYVKDNSSNIAKMILDNVFLTAFKRKDFKNIIIQSYDAGSTEIWTDYFAGKIDSIDKHLIKNTVLHLSNRSNISRNEMDQLIYDNVFGIEMLPRLNALKNQLEESGIYCDIDIETEQRPVLILRQDFMPTTLMRYTPLEAPEEDDEYLLEIYRYYIFDEDMTAFEVGNRLESWTEKSLLTDAVLDEENDLVTFSIKIVEEEYICSTETILNSIKILNEDIDNFFNT